MQLSNLAEHLKGYMTCDQDLSIDGVASLVSAKSNQISFLSKQSLKEEAINSQAGAIISKYPIPGKVCIVVDDPYVSYARATQLFHPKQQVSGIHIHPSVIIEDGVELPSNIIIGSGSVIKRGCKFGDGVFIGANNVLEENVQLGEYTRIEHNITVHKESSVGTYCCIGSGCVIGGDGFGYASHNNRWEKIPHLGKVVIGDRVAIGNNVCIDRGTLDDTIVEDDVILDNLIHIAHNCIIGEGSAIAGQVGFSGGVIVGKRCKVGGQCAFGPNVNVTDDVTIFGKGMVTNSIKESGEYAGSPLLSATDWRKNMVLSRNLYKVYQRFMKIEKK